MAITFRSFTLNPSLMIVATTAVLGVAAVVAMTGQSDPNRVADVAACQSPDAPMSAWSPYDWAGHVECLADSGYDSEAYRAATIAVTYFPQNEGLLNLKGFVAARTGDHASAVYDFRTGQRVTGSPSGVFENNIAWSTLYQLQPLAPERAERVLLEARGLYSTSLRKGWSCERVHTGLFVEYAMADLAARAEGPEDGRVQEAVERYIGLHQAYEPCWGRVVQGDELAVEEILAAAVMDAEMGEIAGIETPTRHLPYLRAAVKRADQIGVVLDSEFCARAVPVEAAARLCRQINF